MRLLVHEENILTLSLTVRRIDTDASHNEQESFMDRVLMVAYHFPPCSGSSGLLRSEKFARFLPEFGWEPLVLTPHPRVYDSVDRISENRVTATVLCAFALDTKKHLSFRESYFEWMALPDRWVTWLFGAIPTGLRAIRKYKVRVIFSTFPISTAILVGLILHRLTKLPWVVDLRDSMTEDDYPKDLRTRKMRRWIERQALCRASFVIFTAASTRRMYLDRYPKLSADRCLLVPNGYDEDDFSSLQPSRSEQTLAVKPLKLLHTGLIYPEERDPMPFFRALSRLKRESIITAAGMRIVLRGSGSEKLFESAIRELDIEDIVQLLPHIPYHHALQECADSDGLLLFQAANCDHQIPAKAYEYLRLAKPILALTTYSGDTANLLNETGGATIIKLADEQDIFLSFPKFLTSLRSGTHSLPRSVDVQRYARRNQAAELADCLNKARDGHPVPDAAKSKKFASEQAAK
jgi:glycosyltransferase involved in cell wall biosynthesis